MRRRLSVATLTVASLLALVTAFAPVAAAGGRLFGEQHYEWTDEFTTTSLCTFDVDVQVHAIVNFRYVAMPDGGFLEVDNFAEQDVFTANGKTLTSEWYHFRISGMLDADFNIVSEVATGQLMTVVLPDGSVFRSAGLYRYPFDGSVDFNISPDRGRSGDVEAFCAALAP